MTRALCLRLPAPLGLLRLLGLLCLCVGSAQAAEPRRVALLVGVGQYADAVVPALEGPAHDIAAVQAALQAHWGFRPADVEVLLDAAASRAGILAGLQRLLVRSAAGDEVFIYFSGHGTSANDRNTGLPLPHTSGAFIPHDLRTDVSPRAMVEQLLVGQRDLRPLLLQLDEGGRRVLVVSDSCYSGQAVRALVPRADGARLVPRAVPLKALAAPVGAAAPAPRPEPAPYPYRHVYYMAAASDSETAMDIGSKDLRALPTVDNRPHGALTDALLRVLVGSLPADRNRDGAVDHAEAFAAIGRFMAIRGYPHTPQSLPSAAEDGALLAHAPLFGTRPAGGEFAPLPAPAASGVSAPVPPPEPAVPAGLRVRLDGESLGAREALQGLPGLQLVGEISAEFSLRAEAGTWQLRSPAADLVLQGTLPEVRRRLQAALWLRRLQQAAAARPSFTLELQALPSTRGGSFIEGERFSLALRSQHRASVLLLAVDPQGMVQVLYPINADEKQPHAASALVLTPPPSSPIVVTPPFGTDELLALAFERPPPFWNQLPQRGSLALSSPLLAAIEQALAGPEARIGSASLLIRSLPRLPAAP
jgi:Caspase domain/Domain of unknown function (DUF4384)